MVKELKSAKKKPISLDVERKSVDQILKEAKSRLNMRKKPKSAATIQGKTITKTCSPASS